MVVQKRHSFGAPIYVNIYDMFIKLKTLLSSLLLFLYYAKMAAQ